MASSLERAANYLDRQMVEPLRQALIARRLFQKVYTLPAGKWNVDVDRISDMNEAQIAYGMPSEEGSRDAINITRENFRLPFLWKDYEIVRSDLEAFASEGINIESASMLNAARKLAEKEEDLLIQGWAPKDDAKYVIKGLYNVAGQSYTTSKDFGTFGNAIAAVSGARSKLWEKAVNGVNFNLVINPAQFAELDASQDTGIDEMQKVLRLLNPVPGAYPGTVIQSTKIVAGKGLMVPVDNAGTYFDLVRASDAKNELGIDSKHPQTSPVYGRTWESLFPRVKHADALCTLTAI
ncbi:MAG: bacteriocin family protein [Methanomassiliicoccus sp.]|nr:bacteriocin family protein [Methanomassiliicoccus sp.]